MNSILLQHQLKFLQVIITLAIAGFSHFIYPIQVLTENAPPYQYQENNELKGSAVVTVKKILDCAKITTSISMLPWKRAYQTTLAEKNTLLFAMARTPQRESKFIWIAPIFYSTAYLYKLKSRTDIKIESLQDLDGFSIGTIPDDYKAKFLLSLPNAKNFKLKYFYNRRSQIMMLLNGRYDLTANDPSTFKNNIQTFNLNPKDFQQLIPLGPTQKLYLAINKNSDEELINTLKRCSTPITKTEKIIP